MQAGTFNLAVPYSALLIIKDSAAKLDPFLEFLLPYSQVRSSARFANRAAAKDDALNELRAKRLKKQYPEAYRKLKDASGGGSSSYQNFSHLNTVGWSSSSQSDSDSRSRSEDEGSSGDDAMIDSDDERSEGLTFDDIMEITIRRSNLQSGL